MQASSPSVTVSAHEERATELERQLDSLCAEVLERLAPKLELLSLPAGPWSELIRASLEAELRAFREGTLPDSATELESGALAAIAASADLDLLLNALRLCQLALWHHWFGLVNAARQLGEETRADLLLRGSEFLFGYAELASDAATSAYYEARERAPEDNRRRRLRAVRAVLRGQMLASSLEHLNYDLDQHHLGLIAWGTAAPKTVQTLIGALERPSLTLAPVDGLIWAWISGARPFSAREQRQLAAFSPQPDSALALGQPDYGEDGFRATHRQAQRARWASRFAERPLIRYPEVAAVALAAENREEARRFVAHELRGIDDDSTDSRRIRETLAAYFAADHNAASAAARLGVHQQTVANRLRTAEERFGNSVGSRRVELELALRLRACLGDQVDP